MQSRTVRFFATSVIIYVYIYTTAPYVDQAVMLPAYTVNSLGATVVKKIL